MDLISFFPRSFFWEGIFIDFLHTPVSIDWNRIIVCRGILYFSLSLVVFIIMRFMRFSFFLFFSSPPLSLIRIYLSLESSEFLDLDRRVDESVDSDGKSEIGPN